MCCVKKSVNVKKPLEIGVGGWDVKHITNFLGP